MAEGGEVLLEALERRHLSLRGALDSPAALASARDACKPLLRFQRQQEPGTSADGRSGDSGSGYDENCWLYPSDDGKAGANEAAGGAGGGLNAAIRRAIREEDSKSSKHGKNNSSAAGVGRGRAFGAHTSQHQREYAPEETEEWLREALAADRCPSGGLLYAKAPGLRRSEWSNDEVAAEAVGAAATEPSGPPLGGDGAEERGTAEASSAGEAEPPKVVSFDDVFSGGTFSFDAFLEASGEQKEEALDDDNDDDDDDDDDGGDGGDGGASESLVAAGAAAFENDSALEKLIDRLDHHDDFWHQAKRIAQDKDRKRWAVTERIERVDEEFKRQVPDPARAFPFELDPFQKEAIIHMERNESVFVAAHTSAGKTVVAEYAFALAARHCSRAVYTSPIKTISNQKFRDFTDGGFDVGLLTGDVSIKPEASSLIMTTEILRSMLYRGANMIRDIEWVIFDEVHYINDLERGVVWEEVIIMLPESVSIVCLSATVPNVVEFADWIGRTKRKNIYITGTLKRPVPLEHFLYYQGEQHKVCEGSAFNQLGYKAAVAAHKKATDPKKPPAANMKGGKRGPNSQQKAPLPQRRNQPAQRFQKGRSLNTERTQMSKLLGCLQKENLLPTIVFAFSKKKCDLLADYIRSKNLTTSEEKHEIHVFCNRSFSRLTGTDRNLPQIKRVQDLLMNGIGVHHSGLLPIVREVVEMLFCRGVVKLLFSTETFAMGVNAPARAVVFHSLRKHDGQSFRTLLSGEYTQMAGRAGRRGLDKFGTVIVACWDAIPGELELKKLLTGAATRLKSQFRLTYNMILNLLRVNEMKIEEMIRRSFAEFHAQAALPSTKALLKKADKACISLDNIDWPIDNDGCPESLVQEFASCVNWAGALAKNLMKRVEESHSFSTIFSPGRQVIHYKEASGDVPQIAAVCQVKTAPQKFGTLAKAKKTVVLFLLHNKSMPMAEALKRLEETNEKLQGSGGGGFHSQFRAQNLPLTMESKGRLYSLLEVDPKEILCVFKGQVGGFDAKAILGNEEEAVGATIASLAKAADAFFSDSGSGSGSGAGKQKQDLLVSAKGDLKLQDIDDIQSYLELSQLVGQIRGFGCNASNRLFEQFRIIQAKLKIGQRMSELRHKLSDAALDQMPDFHQRVKVLQHYSYLDELQLVKVKGRVACEIQSCNELLATEMIFRGVLADLAPQEAIALMSALVFQGGSSSGESYGLSESDEKELEGPLKAKVSVLVALAEELKEKSSAEEICESDDYLNFGLLLPTHEWARGLPFATIMEKTEVMEGTIVRTIIRLEETCREFKDAARVMGDPHLLKLMEEASFLIKRDVIFAASLYVT